MLTFILLSLTAMSAFAAAPTKATVTIGCLTRYETFDNVTIQVSSNQTGQMVAVKDTVNGTADFLLPAGNYNVHVLKNGKSIEIAESSFNITDTFQQKFVMVKEKLYFLAIKAYDSSVTHREYFFNETVGELQDQREPNWLDNTTIRIELCAETVQGGHTVGLTRSLPYQYIIQKDGAIRECFFWEYGVSKPDHANYNKHYGQWLHHNAKEGYFYYPDLLPKGNYTIKVWDGCHLLGKFNLAVDRDITANVTVPYDAQESANHMSALLQELNAKAQLECTPLFPTDYGNVQTDGSLLNAIQITSNGTITSPSITTLSSVTNTSPDGTTLTLIQRLTKLISGPDGSYAVTHACLTPGAKLLSVNCNESDYVWSYDATSSMFSINVTLHSTALVNITYYESYYVLKAQLHTHTTASDGELTPTQVVDLYKQAGYDVIAITDHSTISGVAEAQLEGDKVGVIVVPGEEVALGIPPDPSKYLEWPNVLHVAALFTRFPVQTDCWGKPLQYGFDKIHAADGIGIVAHPFANWTNWQPFLANHTSYIDGWEIAGGYYGATLSSSDISTLIAYGYLYTAAHDYHKGQIPTYSYQILFCVNRTVSGVREALTSRRSVVSYVPTLSVYGTSQAIELFNRYSGGYTDFPKHVEGVQGGNAIVRIEISDDLTYAKKATITVGLYDVGSNEGSLYVNDQGPINLPETGASSSATFDIGIPVNYLVRGTNLFKFIYVGSIVSWGYNVTSFKLTVGYEELPKNWKLTVRVVDKNGVAVQNAAVGIYKESLVTSGVTDSSGSVSFTLPGGIYNKITADYSGQSTAYYINSTGGYWLSLTQDTVVTIKFPNLVIASSQNLMKNPGFESGSTNWQQYKWGTNSPTFSVISNDAHSGTNAAKVSMSSYSSGEAGWAQDFRLTAGKEYKVRLWYKGSASSLTLFAFFFDSSWKYLSCKSLILKSTSSWTQTPYLTFTVPTNAVTTKIIASLKSTGYVLTDDYELYSSESTPPPPPTTYKLTVTTVDKNAKPLSQASVSVYNQSLVASASTDSSGNAQFTLQKGRYTQITANYPDAGTISYVNSTGGSWLTLNADTSITLKFTNYELPAPVQKYNLIVKAVDKNDKPVANAQVKVYNQSLITSGVTDSSGSVTFTLPKGIYDQITADYTGQATVYYVNSTGGKQLNLIQDTTITIKFPNLELPTVSNLIKNPGFETGTGTPGNWQKYKWGTNTATFTWDSTDKHSGAYSAKVSISSYTSGEAGWAQDFTSLTVGAQYKVRCWYKSNVQVTLFAFFFGSNWNYIGCNSLILSASSSWTQSPYLYFKPPSGCIFVKVIVSLKKVGWVSVDDFEMYPA